MPAKMRDSDFPSSRMDSSDAGSVRQGGRNPQRKVDLSALKSCIINSINSPLTIEGTEFGTGEGLAQGARYTRYAASNAWTLQTTTERPPDTRC